MPPTSERLPFWTWWLPLPAFHLATLLSLTTQFQGGIAILYLPFALGLVLTLWWGPRVLVGLYANAMLSAPLWGLDWHWAPVHALPETLGVVFCYLALRWRPFDAALPDISHLLRFILLGVLVPTAITCLALLGSLLLLRGLSAQGAPQVALSLWLADSLTALVISIPLLTYVTPWLRRRGWSVSVEGISAPLQQVPEVLRALPSRSVLLLLLVCLPVLLELLPLSLKLPLIGLVMLSLALVWGFAGALCGAAMSVLSILALPWFHGVAANSSWIEPQRLELHFSILLLTLAALLVGRSLSDLRLALSRSDAMQRQLALANLALDASPLAVVIADARREDLPLIYCNPSFERITGHDGQGSLGLGLRRLLRDEQRPEEMRVLETAIRRGAPGNAVLRLQRKDGQPFWSEVILAPMHDESGLSHFIVMQQDVSARERLAQEVARQREELLQQSHLFSQTEDIASLGGWVLNLHDMSMYWSAGCFKIYELDPRNATLTFEESVGQFDAAGQALAYQTLQKMIEGDERFDLEVKVTTFLGKTRWIRLRGAAERDGTELVRLYGAVQDITTRRRTEQQLRERDDRLRLFFEAPLIGMALITPTFGWEEVNLKLCGILGRSREQLLACSWETISLPEDLEIEHLLLDDVLQGSREGFERDRRFIRPDGAEVHTRLNLRAVRRGNGRVSMFLLLVEDISARFEAEARYRTIVEHAPEAILLYTRDGGMVDFNENALRMFACRREDLLSRRPFELSPLLQPNGALSAQAGRVYVEAALQGDAPVFEWTHRDSSGRHFPCEVSLVRLPGEPALIRCSISDISERQRYQREIERLAYSDELTGLPNRRLLLDRLQHAMDREMRDGSLGALLFIDLDHFKTVNDSLGHLVGDSLLREVTARLAGQLRAEDTLARMGGDEFVVLLEALDANPQLAGEQAALTAERLLKSLEGTCLIEGHELAVSASIGIALHPFGEQNAADVLKQADTAMYRAKQAGRNALHFFAPEMQAAIDQRLQLQGELRQAIVRNQLYLAFQPQLRLDDGQVIGAEVLVRWAHPERGEVMPGQFIPLAEETGLIKEIGNWVLEQACATLQRWLPECPQLVLAVNLSPRELRSRGCVARVSSCLQRHAVPAAALELEITEGVLLEDVEQCIANMQALKALGVRFSIDDFGTGYSSLTYLKRLPLDRLKIDRSFTQDLGAGETGSNTLLVETILMIARNLDLECVAEGIETPEQLEHLKALGCEFGQGYLLGKPMAEADFRAWIERSSA
ncbi:diguanylate cyclase (GGDEF)-like protein/PAS domain S-box-containing protein [Pseudomonas sp. BIGb0408]|uniref:cyclic-guanylate-specific phosphodiesterase n=1 Tax=Phytopseudomonas flavescens TaxID=29435 RepID=A0A7Y9XRF6_9GAMM|nr:MULTISPECIES: EAL domain-containing protein [Pseudomonas]MCW2294545.1 diguanylate cyclase (GGDEF)-like protein/PAS domain S-box-containing protein [Pseudomonas sp. BIGb0408]NYH76181.1 diguanylate cyclase (GGDEF)-like protein/PAS domain S-box-containing protein [Pseudomonas flavescens]